MTRIYSNSDMHSVRTFQSYILINGSWKIGELCHGSRISYGMFLIGLKMEEISDQDLAHNKIKFRYQLHFSLGGILFTLLFHFFVFYYQIISVTSSFTAEKNKIKSISDSIQRKLLLTIP